jgi:hypothetical protein
MVMKCQDLQLMYQGSCKGLPSGAASGHLVMTLLGQVPSVCHRFLAEFLAVPGSLCRVFGGFLAGVLGRVVGGSWQLVQGFWRFLAGFWAGFLAIPDSAMRCHSGQEVGSSVLDARLLPHPG